MVRCLGVCVLSVLPLRSKQTVPCASWRLMISVFSYDSSITPEWRPCMQVKNVKK